MVTQPPRLFLSLSAKRIKLTVAYDGTDFCGWASQVDQRTVHGTLTETVRQISGEDYEIIGASRTDSGAHAKGQVCHFDTTNPMPIEKWKRAFNDRLPLDVSIVESKAVSPDFHSRFSADRRWYRYRIQVGDRDPHRARFTFNWYKALDVELMNRSAQTLVGEHDFYAFSQDLVGVENTVRTLFSVDVKAVKDEIWVDVVGTAFVRGMMRRISGSLWEIGRGQRPSSDLVRLLTEPEAEGLHWPTVLPAKGLTLMKVFYGRHPRDNRLNKICIEKEDDNE